MTLEDDFKSFKQLSNLGLSSISLETSLIELISTDFLQLVVEHDLNLLSIGNSDTEDVVCITNKTLLLSLTHTTYMKAGLQGKKSRFRTGYGNKHSTNKYIIRYDLNTLPNDPRYERLMWSFKNVLNSTFKFNGSAKDDITSYLSDIEGIKISSNIIRPQISISEIDVPDLDIRKKDWWLVDTLEWLSYASINGSQLHSPADNYVSSYSVPDATKKKVVKISWKGNLISPLLSKHLYNEVGQHVSELQWADIQQIGVKNTPISWGMSEHEASSGDGTNSFNLLVSNGKYVLWELIGGNDTY